jgi:hypothetical protein
VPDTLYLDIECGAVCKQCGLVVSGTIPSVAPGGATTRQDDNDGAQNTAAHSSTVHTSGIYHYAGAGGCTIQGGKRSRAFLGSGVLARGGHAYRTPIQRSVHADRTILEGIYHAYLTVHLRVPDPSYCIGSGVFSTAFSLAISLKEQQYSEKEITDSKKAPTNRGSKRFGVLCCCLYTAIIRGQSFLTEDDFMQRIGLPLWRSLHGNDVECERSIKGGFGEARTKLNARLQQRDCPLSQVVRLCSTELGKEIPHARVIQGKHPGFWKAGLMDECQKIIANIDPIILSEHKPHALGAAVVALAGRNIGMHPEGQGHPLKPIITPEKCAAHVKAGVDLVKSHIARLTLKKPDPKPIAPVQAAAEHPFKRLKPCDPIITLKVVSLS